MAGARGVAAAITNRPDPDVPPPSNPPSREVTGESVSRSTPDIDLYNVRSLHTSKRVTVMKRFEAFNDPGRPFDAKVAWKKATQTLQAVRRLGLDGGKKQKLSADFILVTGHELGLMQVRNFDTGMVIGSGLHYNDVTVSCIQVTNSYVFTAVEKRSAKGFAGGAGTKDDHSDIFVWDLTNMTEIQHTLQGHEDRVCCLSVPPWRETQPVSGSLDKTVMIWDITQGRKPIHVLRGHQMMLKFLLVSRECIVSGSSDQTVKVWGWDGKETAGWQGKESMHNGPIQFMCWSAPTLDRVLTACGGGVVRECHVEKGGALKNLWHNKAAKGQILALGFDEQIVISSSSESSAINFFDRESKENKKVQLHEQAVRTISVDGQRKAMLSGSDDGIIIVWNYRGVEEGRQPTSLLQVQAHRAAILSMVLEKDLRGSWERIFTCAGDNSIFVIDFVTDRDSRTHQVQAPPTFITEIKATGTLVTADGASASLWNTRKMQHKSEYTDGPGLVKAHKEALLGLQYDTDDQKLVTCAGDQSLKVFDVSFYDEGDMAREELITPAGAVEMRYQIKCMSQCFGQVVGIGMEKAHRQGGAVQVVNFVSIGGEAPEVISNFMTATPPLRISFVGIPNEEITHVICMLSDHELVMYELSGKVVRSLAPAADPLTSSVPYIEWTNNKYDPARHVMLVCREDLIKEIVIILDGSKAVHDVKTEWASRCGCHITCSALVQQAGIYVVVGLSDGTFRVLDQYGKTLHTVGWDGGTTSEAQDKEMVAPTKIPRRQSYCNKMSTHDIACASSVEVCVELRYVVMGFEDGCVQLWDTTMRRVVRRFYAHREPILRTVLMPSTRRLMSATARAVRFDVLDVREDGASAVLHSPKHGSMSALPGPGPPP